MGLFTGLLTLPLAPVRGTAWVVQQIAEEAERELYDESRMRRELLELELEHDAGRVDESAYRERADDLLRRLAEARARRAELEAAPGQEMNDG
jgi:glycine/D-amino acid oxidase-like deaminating enzyme